MSARLIQSNTAFADESLYLWAGRLELSHWMHGSPVPNFATYFSGAPVLYPPLGAIADQVGGLTGARLLSLAFMLGATALLAATTKFLFNRRAGVAAAAVFAALGPAQFLGAFATYDAMAIFLLALATWCAAQARGRHLELYLVACGIVMATADATKYASALWNPIVLAIIVLTPRSGVARSSWRAARVLLYGGVPTALLLWFAAGHSYIRGILFTTIARQADSTPASASRVLLDSFNWIGIIVVLALIGAVVTFRTETRRRGLLAVVLTGAALLAPLHQAQIHTTTSLHKHVVFGAWFAAIVAGVLIARAAQVSASQGWKTGAVATGLILFIGFPQATSMFVYGWPNTTRMNAELTKAIPASGCPCLISEQSQFRYYLPQQANRTIAGPYSFYYWSDAAERVLHGVAAYRAAITQHYFHVVEIDPAENAAIYGPVTSMLSATPGYRRVANFRIDHWGRKTMQIWRYESGRAR